MLNYRVVLGAGLLLVVPPLASEPADRAELEALRQQVEQLQHRVEQLEAGLASTDAELDAAKPPRAVPGGWRKAANWRVLSTGMEAHRVKEVLGEPDAERQVGKFHYYEYGDGLVRLYFDRTKSWEVPAGLDED